MLNRAITYSLLILIVLQSGMAMGDAHRLHQSGAEHVVFSESHQHLEGPGVEHKAEEVGTDDSSSEEWDCHHCCHCHVHCYSAILMSAEFMPLSKSSSPVPDFSEQTFPDTFETFLRPPQA